MKKIFIYYSLTGNGDLVANILKEKGCDIRKVITKEELPKNNILRILTGGYKAMINYEDKLNNFDCNIDNYDEIIIGSPIWNGRLSSPINSVLKLINIKNKKVNFILYSGGGKDRQAAKLINKKYPNSNIIRLKEPLKNKEELHKILQ